MATIGSGSDRSESTGTWIGPDAGTTDLPSTPTERDRTPGLHGRRLERLDENTHRVIYGGEICGFIEEVGPVYVSLAGRHYATSVEICQSLALEQAVLVFSRHG